jgi:hypothetical protein
VDYRDRKGGKHGTRSSKKGHGAPNQGSDSVTIVKYQAQTVEIKEILSAPMDQQRFPFANTCKELFIKWLEYEKSLPLK